MELWTPPKELIRPDRHHVLSTRKVYNSTPETARLRAIPGLIPRMERGVHNALHENTGRMPRLSPYLARLVLEHIDVHETDSMRAMDDLMTEIEYQSRCRSVTSKERRVGQRVIHAVDIQRPYVREGIIKARHFDMKVAA